VQLHGLILLLTTLGDLPPPHPLELSFSDVGISSARLSWTPSRDPRLGRYELWRDSSWRVPTGTGPRTPAPWLVLLVLATVTLGRRAGTARDRCRASSVLAAAAALFVFGIIVHSELVLADDGRSPETPSLKRGNAILVYQTSIRSDDTFEDVGLRPNWPYLYWVEHVLTDEQRTASNVVEIQTLPLPTPTPTATPIATPTPSPTPTSTRTPTPCAELPGIIRVPSLGAPGRQSVPIRIGDEVVASKSKRLTVSGTLCWESGACSLASVGPGGVPVEEGCLSTQDCNDDPFFLRNHAAFYFQRNHGSPVFATAPLGQSQTFHLQTLMKGDIITVGVNDGDVSNNRDGFAVTLEYTYLHPDCASTASP
jgi:hypothetical protein